MFGGAWAKPGNGNSRPALTVPSHNKAAREAFVMTCDPCLPSWDARYYLTHAAARRAVARWNRHAVAGGSGEAVASRIRAASS